MGKVRRPDGAIKGESVVPLSKGISEGSGDSVPRFDNCRNVEVSANSKLNTRN